MDLIGVTLSKYSPERGNLEKLQRSDLVAEAQRWAAQDEGLYTFAVKMVYNYSEGRRRGGLCPPQLSL